MPSLGFVGFTCGNDANRRLFRPIAANHDQKAKPDTQAKENETILIAEVLRIGNDARVAVKKRGACLIEGNTVLTAILYCFSAIPFECDVMCRHIVAIL